MDISGYVAPPDVPGSRGFSKMPFGTVLSVAMTSQNVFKGPGQQVVRRIYVPATVATVVGWPGHVWPVIPEVA